MHAVVEAMKPDSWVTAGIARMPAPTYKNSNGKQEHVKSDDQKNSHIL